MMDDTTNISKNYLSNIELKKTCCDENIGDFFSVCEGENSKQ